MPLIFPAGFLASQGNGNDAFTKLLLHSDGTNGGTTFTDSSSVAKACVAHGGAVTDTGSAKFGTSSMNLPSASSSYVTVGSDASWNLSTGDFTIDCWVKANSLAALGYILDMRDVSELAATSIYCYVDTNGAVNGGVGAATLTSSANAAINTSTFTHVAVERFSSACRLYVGGTATGVSVSDSTSINCSAVTWKIGARTTTANFANYHIDEFRFSTVARYRGSNFSPSTIAYS